MAARCGKAHDRSGQHRSKSNGETRRHFLYRFGQECLMVMKALGCLLPPGIVANPVAATGSMISLSNNLQRFLFEVASETTLLGSASRELS